MKVPALAVVSVIAVVSMSASPRAQWLKISLPDTPRNADGTPNLSAPAPKVSDGRPDLSGLWRLDYVAVQARRPDKFKDFGKRPIGLDWFLPQGEEIPLLPAAAVLYEQRSKMLGAGSPPSRCLPHTVPDAMIFSDMKLVQTPRSTVILFEEFNHFRQVFTDGRSLPQEYVGPAWFGYSVGRWEGEAFVVDTAGFNDRAWLDDAGLPRSERLHTTETFTRRDFGHLDVRIAFDDPDSFRRRWSVTLPFVLQPEIEFIEGICDNERDSAHMVGK